VVRPQNFNGGKHDIVSRMVTPLIPLFNSIQLSISFAMPRRTLSTSDPSPLEVDEAVSYESVSHTQTASMIC
jgi:hypothetical protein